MRIFAALIAAVGIAASPALAADLWVDGITEPIHDITMNAPVTGVIGKRLVEEGSFVEKGQVLVELQKGLEELDLARKRLLKEMARIELDRLQKLAEKNAISVSREEIDTKETEFNIAGLDLELAQEHLKRRLLISPIEGHVTEIFLEVGEGCELRQPVVRVVETRSCYFVTNIDAKIGHGLEAGQTMRLEIESGTVPIDIEGTINFVSPVVDPASGLMRVKLILDNTNGAIRPGVAGRMRISQ